MERTGPFWSHADSTLELERIRLNAQLGLEVDLLARGDIDQALELFDKRLGVGYVTDAGLGSYILPFDQSVSATTDDVKAGFVVRKDDVVVGVATARLFATPEAFLTSLPSGQQSVVEDAISLSGHVGVLQSVAVAEEWSGFGVATALISAAVAWMAGETSTVVTVGWTDGDGCHIRGVVLRLGFVEALRVQRFWHSDALLRGYSCPSCLSACFCEARVFVASNHSG